MFITGQLAETTSNILTVNSSETVYLKTIIIHNTSANQETVFLHLVKNDAESLGVADSTNIVEEIILDSKETSEFSPSYPVVLTETNDAVFASCSTENVVNYFITGIRN